MRCVAAVSEGTLASINLAVDACNTVSLRSGLPISVVDLDRAQPPLRVAVAGSDQGYVFNATGQVIDVEGLPCLLDAAGACANAVKDAQRTKTSPATRATLSLVWGASVLSDRTARTVAWYREVLERRTAFLAGVPWEFLQVLGNHLMEDRLLGSVSLIRLAHRAAEPRRRCASLCARNESPLEPRCRPASWKHFRGQAVRTEPGQQRPLRRGPRREVPPG